jgi:hypothetical protein
VYGETNLNKKTYIQCTQCGCVHYVNKYIPFKVDYLKSFCRNCEKTTVCLNLGQDDDDKYIYMDINLDSRYF